MRGTKPIRDYFAKGDFKSGYSTTRLYGIWTGIKTRCFNPNDKKYHVYGGRGISLCDEWKSDFKSFAKWSLENGYEENLSIDRIDSNKNYEPSNCRWTDMKVQQNNRTNNHLVILNGETHTVMEWSRIIGVNHRTICNRLKKGYSPEQALNPSIMNNSQAGSIGAFNRWKK